MADNVTRDLMSRFERGDPITDAEVNALVRFLDKAETALKVLGPDYGLALRDVRHRLHRAESYQQARRRG